MRSERRPGAEIVTSVRWTAVSAGRLVGLTGRCSPAFERSPRGTFPARIGSSKSNTLDAGAWRTRAVPNQTGARAGNGWSTWDLFDVCMRKHVTIPSCTTSISDLCLKYTARGRRNNARSIRKAPRCSTSRGKCSRRQAVPLVSRPADKVAWSIVTLADRRGTPTLRHRREQSILLAPLRFRMGCEKCRKIQRGPTTRALRAAS